MKKKHGPKKGERMYFAMEKKEEGKKGKKAGKKKGFNPINRALGV